MYAVLKTGGKQYKAEVGQVLTVEKLDVPAGEQISFDQVLMISDDGNVTVGTPVIAGAAVSGKVVRQDRGPKIIVFKYKPKVRYRRKTGHRQSQTHVLVQAIQLPGGERVEREQQTQVEREQQAPVEREQAVVATAVPSPAEEPVQATPVQAEQTAPVQTEQTAPERTEGLAESTGSE